MKYRPSPIAWLEARDVRLVRVGDDRYRCSCPVHGGNPGTMGISRVDGVWLANCFSCGFHGDSLSLVMAVASVPFPQALTELGVRPGDVSEPVRLHKKRAVTIACDVPGCGHTLTAEEKTYRRGGFVSAEDEVLTRADIAGWWIGTPGTAANGEQFAICEAHT